MAVDKIWKIREVNKDKVDRIANTHHLSNVLATILYNRGLTEDNDIQMFLNPTFDGFYDPFLLQDMNMAVDRILKAKENDEKICIYGDYDVDGVTSTSVLYLFLKEIGCHVSYYIPDRHEEGYGVNNDALDRICKDGNTLVLTVDTGITAVEQAAFAAEIGLDLIITDHHECGPELPNALAVIDPKRPTCPYPFKALAGCGVCFKLVSALAVKLDIVDKTYKYLDIVAVGTVADIVPLKDENRIIVKNAFKTMFNTWNMGLKALLDVSDVKEDKITAGIIGFRIGPRLNAAGRLGDAKRCVKLFTSSDKDEVVKIAKELDEENKERQQIEHEIFEEADALINKKIDIKNTKVIVVAGEAWNHGVIGIVASRITEKYYRPTILLTIKEGIASGSARSVEGFNLFEALNASRPLFQKFGGHEMAAGMSLIEENVEVLRSELNQYAEQHMTKDTLIQKIAADMTLEVDTINEKLINSISKFEPYGMGNEEPKFVVSGNLLKAAKIGAEKTHLKIVLEGEQKKIDGVGFRYGDFKDYLIDDEQVNVVATLNINHWNNNSIPQLMIKDIKIDNQLYRDIEFAMNMVYQLKDEDIPKLQNKNLVPDRKSYENIYRLLIAYQKKNISKIYMVNFCNELSINDNYELIRVFLCFRVFEELALIDLEINKYYIDFNLIKGKKVELTDSKLYNDMSYRL